MSDYDDHFAIRPEDFRRSWPYALKIASEELFETVKRLESVQENVMFLVNSTPGMMKIAQNHVMDSSKRGIQAIEAAYAQITLAQKEIAKAREDFLKFMKIQTVAAENAFADAREMQADAKLYLAKMQTEKAKFNAEKLEFGRLSIWKRIFYKYLIP